MTNTTESVDLTGESHDWYRTSDGWVREDRLGEWAMAKYRLEQVTVR